MPRRLSRSKWIWTTASAGADEYAEFKEIIYGRNYRPGVSTLPGS